MTAVYQTIHGDQRGNCLAAIWASMLDLDINVVPNFVEQDDYFGALCNFLLPFGYEYCSYVINPNRTDLSAEAKAGYEWLGQADELPEWGSINGYYDATVFSPGFWDAERFKNDPDYKPVCHAVVVDKDLNVVHDPNPAYKGMKYPMADEWGYNGVLGVCLFKKISNTNVVAR